MLWDTNNFNQWRIKDFRTGGGKDEAPQAPRSSAVGARIEAPKAPRGWVWGGGVPLPTGDGVWRGGCAPPQIFF